MHSSRFAPQLASHTLHRAWRDAPTAVSRIPLVNVVRTNLSEVVVAQMSATGATLVIYAEDILQ